MAWIKVFISKVDVRRVLVFLSILFALPLGWGAFTGITIWLSPFVLLNSVFMLKSFVWLNTISVLCLILIILLRRRWFCQKICPLGLGCDLVSSCRKGRGPSLKRVPPLGKWLAISSLLAALAGIPLFIMLDPLSVLNSFFVIFAQKITLPILVSFLGLPVILAINLPFPGIWCSKLCPLGGLQDEISTLKDLIRGKLEKGRRTTVLTSTGRRLFLVSGAGLMAGLFLPSLIKPGRLTYLKPPGSVPEDIFNTLCLRCGSCIKSCPTGILEHHMDLTKPISWMVPEINFTNGYCLENCNTCSKVCPSGAINLFTRDAKNQLFIGLAEIELEDCFLSKNKECDRCIAVCSYDAIKIEPGEGAIQMLPVVSLDKCVGCGACEVICPPRVIKIIPYPINTLS